MLETQNRIGLPSGCEASTRQASQPLGTLYAVLIGLVLFLPLQAGLQKRLGESVDDNVVPAGLLMVVYCTVMTALVFAILTASFHTPGS